MLIQSTKKLLNELNIKPESQPEEDSLFSWHANLLTVNRRKAVVLVNDKNRYVIVLHGLKAKDFKKLDEHILQAIRKTFQDECIKNEVIEQFINHSKKITFTKTKDRTSVARMNKACETMYFYEELLDGISIYSTAMSIKASRYLVGDGKNRYIYPNDEMYKDLETFAGRSIFSSKAVELKVTLNLENHHVWRRFVVPINLTFSKLHKVLQVAFGWKDYHLHDVKNK